MSDQPIVVVVPGDLHLTEPGLENHRVAHQVVDEVNRLVRPDYVQFIGDNVQDATEAQFRLFDEVRGRLSVPHHALVGDHDVQDDPRAQGFRAHVGETYGSTAIRGFRFIRLDTQQARPLGLGRQQVDWFRAEVDAAIGAGERAVIFQHNYPFQIWETFDGPGIEEWRAIVQTRPIAAILAGHTHYWQLANDGRNVAVAARSIGDPEGGPPGYLIASFYGDDLAVAYRSVEDRGPIVLITHPRDAILATGPAHVVVGPDRIRVRTWSEAAITTVRSRVDDRAWVTLEVDERVDSCWSAPLLVDRLRKGEHTLAVEVCDDEGCRAVRSIRFVMDPTGWYTAVPRVEPRVEQTAFC
jgi:hypothetical protein